jgi:hypothetical protein
MGNSPHPLFFSGSISLPCSSIQHQPHLKLDMRKWGAINKLLADQMDCPIKRGFGVVILVREMLSDGQQFSRGNSERVRGVAAASLIAVAAGDRSRGACNT